MSSKFSPAAIHATGELSSENILIMISSELGYVIEYGFTSGQYIIKKPVSKTAIGTLYCSARIEDDIIKLIAHGTKQVSLSDPASFDIIKKILDDNTSFMLLSGKSFEEPICGGNGDRR